MKKLLFAIPLLLLALTSCAGDDDKTTWDTYTEWREINQQWVDEQADLLGIDGKPVYTKVVPAWNKGAYVLVKWHNDTMLTCDNLRPLSTSTIDVKYKGRLYNDEPFDSSYTNTVPADSIYRSRVNDNINGWIIAMERIHVGDSVTLIVPYGSAYGSSSKGKIKPFSALQFDLKLVDIPGEYIRP